MTTTASPTALREIIDAALSKAADTSLDDFVAQHRPDLNWEFVAQKIYALTSRHVTATTLQRWYADDTS